MSSRFEPDPLHTKVGQRAQALAKRHGLRWTPASWPGFTPGAGHHADSADILVHEVAHHRVAAKHRRTKPFFGLPMLGNQEPGNLSTKAADREEERASLLGIAMLYEIGGKWKLMLCDHGWYARRKPAEGAVAEVQRVGQELVQAKLMKKTTLRAIEAEVGTRGYI